MEGPTQPSSFFALHAAWFLGSILSASFLYLRPRPRIALVALITMHGLAYLGYYGGLPRTYAVGVSSDRALGVGMAMATAAGGSPYNHVQVEFGNLEPLWTFTVAALSGFNLDRVPWIYDHMTIVVLTLTALGFYRAWSAPEPGEHQANAGWRGVLVAASVLGLSSMALAPEPPIHHFWHGNFVFKPNHALAFGLVGLLSRVQPATGSWIRIGLLQAVLIWAFILDWAYLLPGLFLAALFASNRPEAIKRAVLGTALGLAFGLPYILHLLGDYNPMGRGEMPQIWRDQMGERLNHPGLWTLDLGPLLLLSLLGLYFAFRHPTRENGALGFFATGPLVAACYVAGLEFGFAPEPDEGFYYARMVAGAGAGYALWRLATRGPAGASKRFALVFGLVLVGSYPAYFDPNRDDRYYPTSSEPLPPPVTAAADWISANTPTDAVLISSEGILLSGLTGRRFLMVRPDQTADRNSRIRAERDILTSLDEVTVRKAANRYRVTYVVLDNKLREAYGEAVKGLGNRPWFEPGFANSFARILRIRTAGP